MDVLRHPAATLACRAAQVLRGAPPGFAASTFAPSTRQPLPIVAHMADLMAWGVTLARGDDVWKADASDDWNTYTFARSESRPALSVGPGPGNGTRGPLQRWDAAFLARSATHELR